MDFCLGTFLLYNTHRPPPLSTPPGTHRRQKGKGAKLANDISYCTSPMLRTPSRRAILSSLYLPQVCTSAHTECTRARTHQARWPRSTILLTDRPSTTTKNTPPPNQLLAWVDTFGRDQVHVVTKEEMERAPQAVLKGLYKFLGMCEPTGADAEAALAMTRENVRDGLAVPEGYGLNEADMLDLSEAFQPWNQALYSFLDRDLAWPVRVRVCVCVWLMGTAECMGGGTAFGRMGCLDDRCDTALKSGCC
jgi:hypothetical protein